MSTPLVPEPDPQTTPAAPTSTVSSSTPIPWNCRDDSKCVIGIVVGVLLAVILIAAVIAFLYRRLKVSRKSSKRTGGSAGNLVEASIDVKTTGNPAADKEPLLEKDVSNASSAPEPDPQTNPVAPTSTGVESEKDSSNSKVCGKKTPSESGSRGENGGSDSLIKDSARRAEPSEINVPRSDKEDGARGTPDTNEDPPAAGAAVVVIQADPVAVTSDKTQHETKVQPESDTEEQKNTRTDPINSPENEPLTNKKTHEALKSEDDHDNSGGDVVNPSSPITPKTEQSTPSNESQAALDPNDGNANP